MGLFSKKHKEPDAGQPGEQAGQPSIAGRMAMAQQMRAQALQLQAQAMQQVAAFQQAGAGQARSGAGAATGGTAAAGSGTWVRQVLAILAPPQQGYVKRCSCVVCGAPKKLPSVTAYVYCDYCASLIDYDLRRACEGDTTPGPAYPATVNATQAASRAAVAAGDRDTYRDLQRKVYEAYAENVPMAVSHRARNDAAYRTAYVNFMAEFALARAFDPTAQALEAEMKQHVMGIRYGGNMMSPTIEPDSFWPVTGTLGKQIENSRALYRSAGLDRLDPDRGGHLTGKFAWSGFCQGWLGMLPTDAGERLLDLAGLKNEYVPIQAEDGQPRHCGGCGGEFTALPGARAVVCDGCGRTMDLGSAEIPCASCGATMTLPAGADGVACPFCQSQVERAGMR
jgi:DNA-directed RNA polymerase subunit RPC12/RpoP